MAARSVLLHCGQAVSCVAAKSSGARGVRQRGQARVEFWARTDMRRFAFYARADFLLTAANPPSAAQTKSRTPRKQVTS